MQKKGYLHFPNVEDMKTILSWSFPESLNAGKLVWKMRKSNYL